jgi:hypothetical protein
MTDYDVGIVYVLTNPAMPDLIKIGITTSATELTVRLKTLFSTSVPFPFTCYAAYEVANYKKVEKALHEAFGVHRVNVNREFFKMEPHRVKILLDSFGKKDVTPSTILVETPTDVTATEKYVDGSERKSNFTFSAVNIPVGTVLQFADDDTITCTVVDDRKVQYNGVVTSLSNAAQQVLRLKGKEWPSVRGPQMWIFEEETLSERRERLELNAAENG